MLCNKNLGILNKKKIFNENPLKLFNEKKLKKKVKNIFTHDIMMHCAHSFFFFIHIHMHALIMYESLLFIHGIFVMCSYALCTGCDIRFRHIFMAHIGKINMSRVPMLLLDNIGTNFFCLHYMTINGVLWRLIFSSTAEII